KLSSLVTIFKLIKSQQWIQLIISTFDFVSVQYRDQLIACIEKWHRKWPTVKVVYHTIAQVYVLLMLVIKSKLFLIAQHKVEHNPSIRFINEKRMVTVITACQKLIHFHIFLIYNGFYWGHFFKIQYIFCPDIACFNICDIINLIYHRKCKEHFG